MTQKINVVDLAWIEAWNTEKLNRVMQTFAALEQKYPGSYQVHLSLGGKIALTYDRVLPLTLPPARAVVEFEDEDGDFDRHLEAFKQRVVELYH